MSADHTMSRPGLRHTFQELFETIWNELTEILGSNSTAVVVRRALELSNHVSPELRRIEVRREGRRHVFSIPSDLAASFEPETVHCALIHSVFLLLSDLAGCILVERLSSHPQISSLLSNTDRPPEKTSLDVNQMSANIKAPDRNPQAILIDVAGELSSLPDWETSIQDALELVGELLPNTIVELSVKSGPRHVFFSYPTCFPSDEQMLLHHYKALVGEPDARTIIENIRERQPDASAAGYMALPVVAGDSVVGVLRIKSTREHPFSVQHVTLGAAAAAQIGSYMRNVQACQQEVEIREQIEFFLADAEKRAEEARKSNQKLEVIRDELSSHYHYLQRSLLPAEPCIGYGYNLASAYIPAFEGDEIGGDFYDVFETEHGKVGILIGDVSGKGIKAASLAATARSTVRALAYDFSSAGKALRRANAVLANSDLELGSFITIYLAIVDRETGDVLYSGAGHPPPAIRRADGRVEFLAGGQPPLGLNTTQDYVEHHDHLNPGESVLFYTDGISEARREQEMFGLEGIERVLMECMQASVEETVRELLSEAGAWACGQLSDDTAIILVERED